MAYVLTLTNQKGGVGKTAGAVNLAWAWSKTMRVLVVDLDGQRNASKWLGIEDPGQEIVRAWTGQRDLPVSSAVSGGSAEVGTGAGVSESAGGSAGCLDGVGAYADYPLVEAQLKGPEQFSVLRRLLATVGDRYDLVVVDTPPSLGTITTNAVVASDGIVVPMYPAAESLEGLLELRETCLGVVRSGLGHPNILGAYIAYSRSSTTLTDDVAKAAAGVVPVFTTRIRENVAVARAYLARKPVAVYDPTSNAAADFDRLAAEIAGRAGFTKTST